MRYFSLSFLIIIFFLFQESCTQTKKASQNEFCLNQEELASLRSSGDNLGMKEYTICMLNPGIKKLMRIEEFNAIENSHFQYLKSLADSGIISLLGIYTKTEAFNSFVIFNSTDTVYVKQIMEKSPKVIEKLIIPSYYNWYGPVVLTKLNEMHKKAISLPK